MDDSIGRQILDEMKKQTRMNYLCGLTLVLVTGVGVIHIKSIEKTRSAPPPSWTQVDSALKQNDYVKALQITQTLIGSRTDDFYGEEYLGSIYLFSGDLEKAEAHCARAYELYPSEHNEKALSTARKALEFKTRPATN